jgi:rhodanese-related sulfurtransferase
MQEEVKQGAVLLDVRSADEYENQHIDGSINAPFFSLRMQLKTLSHEKPVVVVCRDGKTSEAAAFLLLRHKIEALILKGGMEALVPEPKNEATVVADLRPESLYQLVEPNQTADNAAPGILEEQIRALTLENQALKNTNQELNDKCVTLEFNKQHTEKQYRILLKQMEKLTQVLDKLKGG